MVEFALILPVLMLFVFGIVEFGRAYSTRIELTSAVREGARSAALGNPAAAVKTVTMNAAPGLNPALAPAQVSTNSCTATPPTPAPQDAVVSVRYPFRYMIPFFGSNTWTLTAKGVMRCGG